MVTYLFRYCYAVSLVIMAMMQLHFLRKIHDATLEAQVSIVSCFSLRKGMLVLWLVYQFGFMIGEKLNWIILVLQSPMCCRESFWLVYQFGFMIYEIFRCQQKWSVDCSYGQPVLLCSSWPVDCGHQGAVWQVWQRAWARMPLHALVCREACSWSSHTQAAATGCALWDQNKGMSCLPFIFYEQRGELSIWCSISLRAWN